MYTLVFFTVLHSMKTSTILAFKPNLERILYNLRQLENMLIRRRRTISFHFKHFNLLKSMIPVIHQGYQQKYFDIESLFFLQQQMMLLNGYLEILARLGRELPFYEKKELKKRIRGVCRTMKNTFS